MYLKQDFNTQKISFKHSNRDCCICCELTDEYATGIFGSLETQPPTDHEMLSQCNEAPHHKSADALPHK
jgi:hypothetical protein